MRPPGTDISPVLTSPGTSLQSSGRLRALRATGLLEAGQVDAFDRLTKLAARILAAPTALVSLVDTERQRFASAYGLTGELAVTRQTPLSHSYCKFVVEDQAALVVDDARLDTRLSDSPAIADYKAIAYAGMPLRTPDGHVLGSFCVLDSEPRVWTKDDLALLRDLAEAAETEVALRLSRAEHSISSARMTAVVNGTHDAYISADLDGTVTAWNAAAERMFGHAADDALGRNIVDLIVPERFRAQYLADMKRVQAGGITELSGQHRRIAAITSSGREFPAEMTLQVVQEPGGIVCHTFLTDITGRLVAAAEMEKQRQKADEEHAFLQAVLDSVDVGIAACDAAGNLTFVNRAAREVSGREVNPNTPADEWTEIYNVYEPDGRTRMADLPLRRAYEGESVRGRQMLVKTENSWRRFVANGSPIETRDHRKLGAVVALHDITEAHRAEQLRRARHAVAQVLSDATNAKEASIEAVAAITKALGWTVGEYWQLTEDRRTIVRHSSYTTGDRDLSAFSSDVPLTFERGEGLPGLVWARNGEVWWNTGEVPSDMKDVGRAALHEVGIRVAVGVPVLSGRRVLGVLAFYTDQDLPHDPDLVGMLDAVGAHLGRFVERRWAEDMSLMLADARRNFDRIVAQVNDYVWTVEAVPGEQARLVYGSPNGRAVFGREVTVEDPTTLGERVHPDDVAILDDFKGKLAAGEHAEVECRVVGFDGVVRWVWTRAAARKEGDKLFVDGLSTDVTERHELSDQRERLLDQERDQVEQLRQLDRMKDELSALVIHELRNPVGVIKAYTEILLDSPELSGAERKHASVVDRTTRHLQDLVDDLLDLARLDAGHISINPCPMPADAMLHDVVDAHQPSAAAKNLTVHASIKPELSVYADPQRLRQALDNLLSNAVKYTPEGGTVTVTAQHDGDAVVITISDNGIGIPAEQYPHLFSRFFRASNATQAGIKGTGLGLAVTKAIIDAHDGTLTARPAPDGGTEFTMSLPAPTLDFEARQR
ncbi:PAS domain-containing sensor histidine kinase [Paractinoplanes lichenicola]|uniref:Sensor-like histidine kinase SenX3 n=1 Tax=Paractinoplanes lichenicola TaxID=2802976 RepID=A0ABS1VKV2_9ACTN|nr:ATP-binding protein [Actinoplanes lichenicola]MBL7255355.1 PAS domain S-box protein [Actinoplanes lichenicola]